MFNWLVILALILLGGLDLFLLLQVAVGIGVVIIIISQLITGIFGLIKIRSMDFNLFFFVDAELKKGESIVRELWDETMMLLAVCLLIFPGFISDLIGLALLFPAIRGGFLDIMESVR